MTLLWLNLAIVLCFAWTARYFSVPSYAIPMSVSPNKLMSIAAALCLILVSGLRSNIGDTPFYMHSYEITDFRVEAFVNQKDIGFNIYQMLLKMISQDPQILIFVTALLTNALIVIVMYKYSRLFELSLFLYITSGCYIVSMNGIRQYLAAAILFAATKFLLDGNWKRYMAIVLFASIFHQSAFILIPLYFIVRKRAWTGITFTLLGLGVVFVFGFNQFSAALFSAIQDTQYGEYQSFQEGGANVIRVLFYVAPLIVAYFGRDKLRVIYPKIDIFVNLSILGAIFMIISTQNWIFARMAIYFSLYQIVLVSWIVKAFRERDQKLIYLTLLIVYVIFFFYENVIALGIQYRSDYLTWFR